MQASSLLHGRVKACAARHSGHWTRIMHLERDEKRKEMVREKINSIRRNEGILVSLE